jgi:hypothetical protein
MTLGDTRPIGVRSLGYGNAVCEVVTIACDHPGAAYLARRKLAMSPTPIDVESLMSADLTDPKHWQERAAAVRKTSEQMTNAETKRTMLWVAADYDKLVARVRWGMVASSRRGTDHDADYLAGAGRQLVPPAPSASDSP